MSTQTATLPQTTRGYHIHGPHLDAVKNGFADVLHLETHPLPSVGPHDVLIAVHAVSLNWRDIMIATNTYLRPFDPDSSDGRVPCSDGAGTVLALGSQATRFQVGDRVAGTFFPKWLDGLLQPEVMSFGRGAEADGFLREFAVLGEDDLVTFPAHLSFEEAATLPCAGVTAWNALFGHGGDKGVGRRLVAGEAVLTQGTGGVSLFAAQFALAVGAEVVATTSSLEKADMIHNLTGLPKDRILNYKTNKEWGSEAKRLTKDQRGMDIVVEVTGSQDSVNHSYTALKFEGQVSVIGTRGAAKVDGATKNVVGGIAEIMHHVAVTRRIAVGSRSMFEEMNAFIHENKIRPVVDPRVFDFDQAREALMYLYQSRHFGNIVIKIGQ